MTRLERAAIAYAAAAQGLAKFRRLFPDSTDTATLDDVLRRARAELKHAAEWDGHDDRQSIGGEQ